MKEKEQLISLIGDKHRRLTSGKIYKIKDKSGKVVPFLPNEHQLEYLQTKHNLNIIVKARQLGYSTMIDIDGFDDVLFSRGTTFGIIADTEPIAKEIFRDKIRVMRENLPTRLKEYYVIKTERSNEISFENTGSRVSVGTSYRGGTLQRLHVSEFGKICAKYPEKAREIVTGALETVAQGQKIDIESTAMGASGYFYDFAKQSRDHELQNKELTHMDYKLFFVPRYKEKGYSIQANIEIDTQTDEYFDKIYEENGISLTEEQEKRYFMKSKTIKGDMFREYPSTFDEAFSMNIEGAYYERELKTARQQGRIGKFQYDPALPVHTARDLGGRGGGDDTAIRFFQVYAGKITVIDFREGNGRSIGEIWTTIVQKKEYTYGRHYGPHDLNNTQSQGETTRTIALKSGLRFDVVERAEIKDGIAIVRAMFTRISIDDKKCAGGLDMIGRYRRKYDDHNGVWMDKPEHNGASHAADAFRYMCSALSYLDRGQNRQAIVMNFS